MKFIVSTSYLLKHLSALSGVVPSNPIVPILENFLFEISKNELQVTASDLKTSMVSRMSVEADEDGSIAIPARMLLDTLKNLPDQPVTFTVDFQSYTIELSSDNGKYKIAGENAADFPRVPELGRTDSLEMPSDVLLTAINYTLFATSTDEMKPAMNGVFFEFSEGHTNFVSSDSHRLIRYRREDLTTSYDASMIVDRKALSLLRNALPSSREMVKLEFNSSNAIFSFGETELTCRLIDERFPDYQNVIPLNNENTLAVDRKELIGCLKRLVIYANRATSQVRFRVTGNELRVVAEDLDFSNEANERLFCDHNGEDIEIGFNARFLLEILSNLPSEKVLIKLNEPNRAGLIVPEENGQDEDLIMLIMPIMLQSYV